MPRSTVHNVEVYFTDQGAGTPVLFGHSSVGSGGQWRALAGDLADRYRLIAPDHLGYGRTGAYPGGPPLLQLEIEIIEALLRSLDGTTHLIGHSYGGSLLARVAVRNSERIRSLTLVEPTLFHLLKEFGRREALSEIKAVADRVNELVDRGDEAEAARGFIDYWGAPGTYEAMDERVRATVTGGMRKLRAEWPAGFEPSGATATDLAALKCPVLLLSGSRTTAAARAVVGVLRQLWPAAQHSEVAGASHMLPLTHSTTVNPIIETFLERVDGCKGAGQSGDFSAWSVP